jgi:hypothetical protein
LAGADWQASMLRAALFTQQALPLTTDIFSGFVGSAAEVQEDRPREGTRKQSGTLDNAELQVTISPIRVDIALMPPPVRPENVAGEVPFATGELNAELAKFERRLLVWLPRWEVPTTRVALIVLARAAADSVDAAYEILKNNLTSVRVRPGEMSDLLFRVNWKAKTQLIPEGVYNRLTTWSALKMTWHALTFPTGPDVRIKDRDFAQVEMDINTLAERTLPLPRGDLANIFKEFFKLAAQIAELGEVP